MLAVLVALAAASPIQATAGIAAPSLPTGASHGERLADEAPSHLAIELRLPQQAAIQALLLAQQDPSSPSFHQWLTAEQFGAQFGQPSEAYAAAVSWLHAAGYSVKPYANRLFLEATGTVKSARLALGVELQTATDRDGHVFRTFTGNPVVPAALADQILVIDGLDTRSRYRHHLVLGNGQASMGADDLRNFYDATPLLTQGYGGRNLALVVLGAAGQAGDTPVASDITDFFHNYSQATARYVEDAMPNPNSDTFQQQGLSKELEMDVELQSVGAPKAATITLVEPPASEIFTTGANQVAQMANVAAVSTSIGSCELAAGQSGEAQALQQAVQQGNAAGQTWFAATGDNGTDDCMQGTATVDFPADVPEIVAVGGSEQDNPFDQNGNVSTYTQEVAWNQANLGGGAGGGGVSAIFAKPSWQTASTPNDQGRDLPDIALFAAPAPGVTAENGGSPGTLTPMGGTSVASPLAAGFFALIADYTASKLGGVNPTLYTLGTAQPQVFHDITQGNLSTNGVQGPAAGPGYDEATGWGSLDVNALALAWPGAPPATKGSATGATTGNNAGSSGTVGGTSGGALTNGSSGNGGGSTSGSGVKNSGNGTGGGSGAGAASAGGHGQSPSNTGFIGGNVGSGGSGGSTGTTSGGGSGGCGTTGGAEFGLVAALSGLGTVLLRRRRR